MGNVLTAKEAFEGNKKAKRVRKLTRKITIRLRPRQTRSKRRRGRRN